MERTCRGGTNQTPAWDERDMQELIDAEYDCTSANCRTPLRIAIPYLLVVEQQLPLFRDKTGQVFVNDLWRKDLLMHLGYIDHLMIAAPCSFQEPPQDTKPLPAATAALEIVELPAQKGFWHSLRVMPTIVLRLSRAVRKAGIVHS